MERGVDAELLCFNFRRLLEGSVSFDVIDFGAVLLCCESWRNSAWESNVWGLVSKVAPLRRDIQEIVAGATGHDPDPTTYMDKRDLDGRFLGAQVARHGGHAQHKLAMLVQHVEAVLSRGPHVGQDVLQAIVDFSLKKFNYWLKVAADLKGALIDFVLDHAPPSEQALRLELGAFVGFSGLRLAGVTKRRPARVQKQRCVMSLEVDPLHVCIARHMLNLGERAWLAEVRCGQARDLIPRIMDDAGGLSLELVFMDHRGTRFHEELRSLERHYMLRVGADIICDNVLHPGAPVFLWEETSPTGARRAMIWSVPEFGSEGCIEDWMAFEWYVPQQLHGCCS